MATQDIELYKIKQKIKRREYSFILNREIKLTKIFNSKKTPGHKKAAVKGF